MANTEKVRLNKYLSQAGICSRREADVLIEGGKVSVNGKIADPGMRVNDLDKITVEDKPVGHREKKVVLAYYKPVGVTCTEKDRHAQITIRRISGACNLCRTPGQRFGRPFTADKRR